MFLRPLYSNLQLNRLLELGRRAAAFGHADSGRGQYSLDSIMVMTRVVTNGSDGSGEPIVISFER